MYLILGFVSGKCFQEQQPKSYYDESKDKSEEE